MKDYLLKIFNYNHWCIDMLVETMEKNKVSDEYIIKMMSHILNTQRMRYNTITADTNSNVDLWALHSIENLKNKNAALTELYIKLITRLKLSELNEKIETKTLDGDIFFMTITDILIHIANHGSHHRGQVSLRLRELGIAPPNYGYIYYAKSFPDFW